ncbi:MAG: response regulator transcription factor [Synergistaceae bacterium]|jgi:DNA-binding NarL/FixJ family response regulator|nr:response regulator transcription factor [Synergistaceae bacterium]
MTEKRLGDSLSVSRSSKRRLTIFLADDHPMTRAGLVAWLEREEGIELIGQAVDGESAWQGIRDSKPDVAMLDIEMPSGNGIDITKRVVKEQPETNVLILTAYNAQQYVMAAIRAGAKGFLLKTAPFDQVRKAIFDVAKGIFYLDAAVSLKDSLKEPEELSPREKEVLLLAGQGMSAHEVGARLSITDRTVQAHLASIYGKLGARNKTEAILIALKRGVALLDELHIEVPAMEDR